MGYRSDVTILVYGPEDEMTAFIAAQRLKTKSPLAEDAGHVSIYRYTSHNPRMKSKGIILKAEFSGVKWYHGYPDVDMWVQLMSDAGDAAEKGNIDYEFIRVGEELEDIEQETGPDCEYWLGVSREIVCDLPHCELINQGENE